MENTKQGTPEKVRIASKAEKEINPEDKVGIVKFLPPETPEEFYERAESYLVGAKCCVPFQERANYLKKASDMFAGAGDFRDAPSRMREYAQMAEETLDSGYKAAYENACALRKNAKTEPEYFKAARAFERILDYKDAEQQADACERKLRRIHARKIPIAIAIVVLIIGVVVGCIIGARTDAFRYQLGNFFSAVGIDSVSSTLYKSSLGYADAETQLELCYYRQGVTALSRNDYSSAVSHFSKMSEPYEDSDTLRFEAEQHILQNAQPGQEVYFGKEQWAVLDRQDGRILLLASKPLSDEDVVSCYDPECDAESWKDSWLYHYLNESYSSVIFSGEEKGNLMDDEDAGGAYLFPLSLEQYAQYADIITSDDFRSSTDWWLRDVGSVPGTAAYAAWDTTADTAGAAMNSSVVRIRPAVWVKVLEN